MKVQQGFTIIEILVAFSIMGIAMIVMLPIILSNLQSNTRSEERTQAAAAIRQVFDGLRAGSALPKTGTQTFSVNQGRTFDVVVTYCPTDTALCIGNSVAVSAVVNFSKRKILDAETVITDINVSNTVGSIK